VHVCNDNEFYKIAVTLILLRLKSAALLSVLHYYTLILLNSPLMQTHTLIKKPFPFIADAYSHLLFTSSWIYFGI